MYAGQSSVAGASVLAATGFAAGQMLLVAVALIVGGLAVIALLKKPGKDRP